MLLELIVVRRGLVPEPREPGSIARVADNPSDTEHDQRQADCSDRNEKGGTPAGEL